MARLAFVTNLLGLDGSPESGGLIDSFVRETSTRTPIYAALTGSSTLTNPAVGDSLGQITGYLDVDSVQYSLSAKTADGATVLWEADVNSAGLVSITYVNPAYSESPIIHVSWVGALGTPLGDGWTDLFAEDVPFVYPAGAVGDGVKGYSGVVTVSPARLVDSNAAFVAADVGKVIVIKNAGAARLKVNSATVSAGGTSHAVGDLLTVSGGTSRSATVFRVDAVSAGVVTAVSVRSRGHYTTLPSNPASTTSSGSGTGCTLTLTSETIYEPHRTTIASINSGTSIELTAAPTTSVASSARYTYGTDDTASLQACLNAAGFMGAMSLAAGRVYCFSNLTLPTNAASGNYYKNRNAIVCPDGMAELACIGGGDDDYGIAPDRWLTANANKAFAGSPWEFRNLIIDGLYTVERTLVHKSFSSLYNNCWFRGGMIADFEVTRQNQDGSDGSSGYNSGNKIETCLFDGEGLYQFRSIGDTTGVYDATTDGDLVDCDFNGQAKADYGAYIGNGGGWIISRSRYYSHRVGGCYVDVLARGNMIASCNFEGGDETYDTVPGLIVGQMGGYADAVIGPGNKHYSPVLVDFKADTSAETIRIKGDHFQTKIDASPDATAIHNNNRSQKTLVMEDCTGDADPFYSRASGNTTGIIELYRCTSASATGSLKYITQLRDEPGATTSPEVYNRETASPAANDDIYSVEYYSRDSGGNRTQYAGFRVEIGAATDGAEFGRYVWTTIASGASADRFYMQSGLYPASLTDPGNGNFNALTSYYLADAIVIDANAGIRHPSYTSTALNAIANAINTANKVAGKTVWNSTANKLVSAVGSTAGSVWVDGAGTTVNTPV